MQNWAIIWRAILKLVNGRSAHTERCWRWISWEISGSHPKLTVCRHAKLTLRHPKLPPCPNHPKNYHREKLLHYYFSQHEWMEITIVLYSSCYSKCVGNIPGARMPDHRRGTTFNHCVCCVVAICPLDSCSFRNVYRWRVVRFFHARIWCTFDYWNCAVLGRPKGGRAAMRNVSAIAIATVLRVLHVIYRFSLSHFLLGDPFGGI